MSDRSWSPKAAGQFSEAPTSAVDVGHLGDLKFLEFDDYEYHKRTDKPTVSLHEN